MQRTPFRELLKACTRDDLDAMRQEIDNYEFETYRITNPLKELKFVGYSKKSGIWACYEDVTEEAKITWIWREKVFTIAYSDFGGKHTSTLVLNFEYDGQVYEISRGSYGNKQPPPYGPLDLFRKMADSPIETPDNLYDFLSNIGISESILEKLYEGEHLDDFFNKI